MPVFADRPRDMRSSNEVSAAGAVAAIRRRPWSRAVVSSIAAVALLVPQLAPPASARPMTREQYEACQTRDEASFKQVIEGLTQASLKDGLGRLDYRALVNNEWRRGGVDEVIDRQVDASVAEMVKETSLSERLASLVYREKSQALAEATAKRVYEAPAIKTALEGLTAGVARDVGRTIELSTADAAEPALECLKTYLGPRFGNTVARVVSTDASREFAIDPEVAKAKVGAGAILAENGAAVTGAVILIVRRQLASIATRISQRLVGALLGRLVSVVAGGIGAVLIAKDLWDSLSGVFPIIATEMKSTSTKDLVKDELAKAIGEQIGEHVHEIATATADRVVDIWREFKRGHAKVVELAERDEGFRQYLDTLRPEDLARLDEVVTIVLASDGEGGVLKRLKDGTLAQAVTRFSPAAMEVARDTRSLDKALAWVALAGPDLQAAIDHGLPQRTQPGDFTTPSLKRLLALDDNLAITQLTTVGHTVRDALFELPDASLKALARAVTATELESLARYLGGLDKPARARVLEIIAQGPGKVQGLLSPRVRDGVLASRDQLAAVTMMARADGGFDVARVIADATLAWNGSVQPMLLWDKHPEALIGAGGLFVLLLLLLTRIVGGGGRGRRRA